MSQSTLYSASSNMPEIASDLLAETARKKTVEIDKEDLTPIQRFFVGTKIFLTGGTGFLGILLLEKLLVSCPDISKIFLLVRNKKGKDVQTRMEKFFDDVVFTRLREQLPNFREKIAVVEGDCGLKRLGISDQDREMLIREVDVVFHVAATVRFDEALKKAAAINVKGVIEILDLARQMPRLKSFVHISTAFSNCVHSFIKEEVYPPAMDYQKLLDVVEALPDEVLTKITPLLLEDYPNTYSFTKQIGESVVGGEGSRLPVGIHRPGIVISTYREPLRGWVNNIYGPNGLMTAGGLGLTKATPYHVDVKSNMVPADMVVNSIIASAWDIAEKYAGGKNQKSIPVYNFDINRGPGLTWGTYLLTCIKYGHKYFPVKSIWYLEVYLFKSYFAYVIAAFFVQTIPAAIVDAVRICMRKPPMLLKVYRKLHQMEKLVMYFKTREWTFEMTNLERLLERMSEKDKEIFYSDVKDLNIDEYMEWCVIGMRVYLMDDPLDTLPAGQIHRRRLYWIHQFTKTVVILSFLWMLWCISSILFGFMR